MSLKSGHNVRVLPVLRNYFQSVKKTYTINCGEFKLVVL